MQALIQDNGTSSSETFRRALATAEEYLGPEHPETMNIVGIMGVMYALRGSLTQYGYNPYIQDKSANLTNALPWLQRYLSWAEKNQGIGSPEVQTILGLIAKMYFGSQQYQQAQTYFDRLIASYRAAGMPVPDDIQSSYQLCRMNTRFLTPQIGGGSGTGLDFANLLSSFRRL
jgi:tetratricopeptide (TPR) repeat protein